MSDQKRRSEPWSFQREASLLRVGFGVRTPEKKEIGECENVSKRDENVSKNASKKASKNNEKVSKDNVKASMQQVPRHGEVMSEKRRPEQTHWRPKSRSGVGIITAAIHHRRWRK